MNTEVLSIVVVFSLNPRGQVIWGLKVDGKYKKYCLDEGSSSDIERTQDSTKKAFTWIY